MAIHEAWLFEDDSVLVKFENGCLLQLSSCGAVFRCFSPADNVTNRRLSVDLSDEMQQYSRFATTMWKDMVKQAVNFRNKFACYPYVCPHLSEIIAAAEQHKIVTSTTCTWIADDLGKSIHHGLDGSISTTSKEKNASATLSACKQNFMVKFICKIQGDNRNDSERPTYSWVQQIHSTNMLYPDCFYYPMNLLSSSTLENKSVEITSAVVSDLPQSLPQRCAKPHLHRWRSHWPRQSFERTNFTRREKATGRANMAGWEILYPLVYMLKEAMNGDKIGSSEFLNRELIKVYYSENVFYRFYYEKHLTAEVMLPDGSVLRSTGPTHLYFKHWIYDVKSESVNENVYSTRTPPLNDQSRPVAKILDTVRRYLKYLSVCWKRQTATLCCWKNDSDLQLIGVETELEEFSTHVRGVGSFKTYSNGRMRIVFCDGTLMDFCDPNEKKSKIRSTDNGITRFKERRTALIVNAASYSLTLPNGISFKASFDSPAGPFSRYVQTALGLMKWKQTNAKKEVEDENPK